MRQDVKKNRFSLIAFVGLVFLSACAHQPKSRLSNNEDSASSRVRIEPLDREKITDGIPVLPGQDLVIQFQGKNIKLQNTDFDFPVVINSRVEFWIGYFLGRGRPHFAKYLERSEHFIPFITPLLVENGMPTDLVYLAMIESGFNNHARSHAKAVGPWQFISATGKRYGLMVNWWVDERRDTRKSTLGAIQYLRDLYQIYGSWELAAASYNAGEAKIARAVKRYHTKDFWVIARQKFLRPETRDYVPKIIAAAIVAKNRVQFGFEASQISPESGEALAGDGEVVRLEPPKPATKVGDATIADILKTENYNEYEDSLSEDINPLTVSQSSISPQPIETAATQVPALARPVATPHVDKKGQVQGEQLVEFEVQSPADLLHISRAAGLSYTTVKGLNPELLRWCTPPGVSSYRIKLPTSVQEKFLQAYNHDQFPKRVQFLNYKARGGDTIQGIARHFGIKTDPIVDLNGVSIKARLKKGAAVRLPMPNDQSRSLASLEIRDPPEKKKARAARRSKKSKAKRVSQSDRESARSQRSNLDS